MHRVDPSCPAAPVANHLASLKLVVPIIDWMLQSVLALAVDDGWPDSTYPATTCDKFEEVKELPCIRCMLPLCCDVSFSPVVLMSIW